MDRLFGNLYMSEKYDSLPRTKTAEGLLSPMQQYLQQQQPSHSSNQLTENLIPLRKLTSDFVLVYLPTPTTAFVTPMEPQSPHSPGTNATQRQHAKEEAEAAISSAMPVFAAAHMSGVHVSAAAFADMKRKSLGADANTEGGVLSEDASMVPWDFPTMVATAKLQKLSNINAAMFRVPNLRGVGHGMMNRGVNSLKPVNETKGSHGQTGESPPLVAIAAPPSTLSLTTLLNSEESGGHERLLLKRFCELYVQSCIRLGGDGDEGDGGAPQQHSFSSQTLRSARKHDGGLGSSDAFFSSIAGGKGIHSRTNTGTSVQTTSDYDDHIGEDSNLRPHLSRSPRASNVSPRNRQGQFVTDVTNSQELHTENMSFYEAALTGKYSRAGRKGTISPESSKRHPTIAVLEVPLEKMKALPRASEGEPDTADGKAWGAQIGTTLELTASASATGTAPGGFASTSDKQHAATHHDPQPLLRVASISRRGNLDNESLALSSSHAVDSSMMADSSGDGRVPAYVAASPYFKGWFTIECSTTYRRLMQLLHVTEWPAVVLIDSNGSIVTSQALSFIQHEIEEYDAMVSAAAAKDETEVPFEEVSRHVVPSQLLPHAGSSENSGAGATGSAYVTPLRNKPAGSLAEGNAELSDDIEAFRTPKFVSTPQHVGESPPLMRIHSTTHRLEASATSSSVEFQTAFPWQGNHPAIGNSVAFSQEQALQSGTSHNIAAEHRSAAQPGARSFTETIKKDSFLSSSFASPLEVLSTVLEAAAANDSLVSPYHDHLPSQQSGKETGTALETAGPSRKSLASGLERGDGTLVYDTDVANGASTSSIASSHTHFALYFGNGWYTGCKRFLPQLIHLWESVNTRRDAPPTTNVEQESEKKGRSFQSRPVMSDYPILNFSGGDTLCPASFGNSMPDDSSISLPGARTSTSTGRGCRHVARSGGSTSTDASASDQGPGISVGDHTLTMPDGVEKFMANQSCESNNVSVGSAAAVDSRSRTDEQQTELSNQISAARTRCSVEASTNTLSPAGHAMHSTVMSSFDSDPRMGNAIDLAAPLKEAAPQLPSLHVIYISSDRTDDEFAREIAKMPSAWQFLSPEAQRKHNITRSLAGQYDIRNTPSLLIFETATGKLVQRYGEVVLRVDPDGVNFPWPPAGLEGGSASGCVTRTGAVTTCNSSSEATKSLEESMYGTGRRQSRKYSVLKEAKESTEKPQNCLVVPFFTNPMPVCYHQVHIFSSQSLETQSALRLGGNFVILIGNGCCSLKLRKACLIALREACDTTARIVEGLQEQAQYTLWGVKPHLAVGNKLSRGTSRGTSQSMMESNPAHRGGGDSIQNSLDDRRQSSRGDQPPSRPPTLVSSDSDNTPSKADQNYTVGTPSHFPGNVAALVNATDDLASSHNSRHAPASALNQSASHFGAHAISEMRRRSSTSLLGRSSTLLSPPSHALAADSIPRGSISLQNSTNMPNMSSLCSFSGFSPEKANDGNQAEHLLSATSISLGDGEQAEQRPRVECLEAPAENEEGTARIGRFPLPSIHFMNALYAKPGFDCDSINDDNDVNVGDDPYTDSDEQVEKQADEGVDARVKQPDSSGEEQRQRSKTSNTDGNDDDGYMECMLDVKECAEETRWLLQEHVFSVLSNQDEKLLPPLTGEPFLVWLSLPQRRAAVLRRRYGCEDIAPPQAPAASVEVKEKPSVLYQPTPTGIGTTTMTVSLSPAPSQRTTESSTSHSAETPEHAEEGSGEKQPDAALEASNEEDGTPAEEDNEEERLPKKKPKRSVSTCPAANVELVQEFILMHILQHVDANVV